MQKEITLKLIALTRFVWGILMKLFVGGEMAQEREEEEDQGKGKGCENMKERDEKEKREDEGKGKECEQH